MLSTELKPLLTKPGAKPGYAVLLVDLSEAKNASALLEALEAEGYQPEIRHVEFAIGIHIIAVLKEVEILAEQQYDELSAEWETLIYRLTPEDPNQCIRLWRRRLSVQPQTTAA